MTHAHRLSLVNSDESDSMGDEAATVEPIENPNADTDLAFRLSLDLRLRRIEKQLQQITSTPEIVAALARQANRGAY